MKRDTIHRYGEGVWEVTSGARALPASDEMPRARDLPARRQVRRAVRRRLDEPNRKGLIPLSRRPAFQDN